MSWTTSRSGDDEGGRGGSFFLADYKMRIANAKNTLYAWKPSSTHGTGLQLYAPRAKKPKFIQAGISIFIPNRLLKTWKEYQNGKSRADALSDLVEDVGASMVQD